MVRSLLLAAAGAALAYGQTGEFELASVKPSDPASTMAIRRSGHRIVTVNTSLEFLISWAFDLPRDRILGRPAWLDSFYYDVIASSPVDEAAAPRVPGQPTALQRRMQALLAERFKLAVEKETRELTLYALTVAKGGPKVKLSEPPEVMGQTPFRMPGRGRLMGTQVTAEMLCNVLSGQLNRSVTDATGLRGVFDFELKWEPETPAGARDDGLPTAPDSRAGSSLFTALQEQLGFKLESRKGPAEVLVIRHVERTPTEN